MTLFLCPQREEYIIGSKEQAVGAGGVHVDGIGGTGVKMVWSVPAVNQLAAIIDRWIICCDENVAVAVSTGERLYEILIVAQWRAIGLFDRGEKINDEGMNRFNILDDGNFGGRLCDHLLYVGRCRDDVFHLKTEKQHKHDHNKEKPYTFFHHARNPTGQLSLVVL